MSEFPVRVFEDPCGDPFVRYVEMDGRWFKFNEAALIEAEERVLDEAMIRMGRDLMESPSFREWVGW